MENARLLLATREGIATATLTARLGEAFPLRHCAFDADLPGRVRQLRPGILLLRVAELDAQLGETIEALRREDGLDSMKIVVLSDNTAEAAARIRLHEQGVAQIIAAEIDAAELCARLTVLSRFRADSEVEELKRQFRSLITHETSTPLNAISSYASMIAAEPHLPEASREMIAAVREASLLMEEKIARVLMLSELSSETAWEQHPVYSNDIMSSLEQKLASLAPGRREDVTFRRNTETCFTASFELLRVAAWSLLENALRYSPQGTVVEVEDRVEGAEYVLAVSDQGPGIEVERLNTLFAEFSVDNILHHQNGLGIGLSLSRRIVELHQGRITADNNPGGGACFCLRLPC